MYGYRLQNILNSNEIIYHKLVLEVKYWDNFYKLLTRCFEKHVRVIDDLKNFSMGLKDCSCEIDDPNLLKIIVKIKEISCL